MPGTVTDPVLRKRLNDIQQRLAKGIASVDPHHRLRASPFTYRVIAGHALEIVYRDVTRIDETEVLGIKRLIGDHCFCAVTPQSAETLTVSFVVPLDE
ncbi:MAG TPA: hypothetical protein VGA37_17695 [Gemmatimonadales bacterium]